MHEFPGMSSLCLCLCLCLCVLCVCSHTINGKLTSKRVHAHNMSHTQCMGLEGFAIYIGQRFKPPTIVVKTHCLSNSHNNTHTEPKTTPVHMCLHHLRRNTMVPCITLLSGMAPYCTTTCIVWSLCSEVYPEWAWARRIPHSSLTIVRVCVGQLGLGGSGGGGGRESVCEGRKGVWGRGPLYCAWGAL